MFRELKTYLAVQTSPKQIARGKNRGVRPMTCNSSTLVKCPRKNTGLCLAKYSKISLSHHTKGADTSSNKTFKAAITPGYGLEIRRRREIPGSRDWKNSQWNRPLRQGCFLPLSQYIFEKILHTWLRSGPYPLICCECRIIYKVQNRKWIKISLRKK